jgi:hypothetical protein
MKFLLNHYHQSNDQYIKAVTGVNLACWPLALAFATGPVPFT